MNILKLFFSPEDHELYPPCGMFTTTHLIVLAICFILIGVAFYFTRKINDEKFDKLVKIWAIIFVVMEIIKISYKFYYGYFEVDKWVPISYCSIFIYSLVMSGFFKGNVKKIADAYISGGCLIAGTSFLIVPSTSLMDHPMFHYLSVHSMLFHSAMVYFSLMYLYRNVYELNLKNYKFYFIYVLSFSILAIVLNIIFDSNLMLYSNPYNIPISLINKLYEAFPLGYTLFCLIGYLSIYLMVLGLKKIVLLITKKEQN